MGDRDEGGAHIEEGSEGVDTNDVQLDERSGVVPPPVEVRNLKQAAEEAGCYLELHLRDEGHEHVPPGSPEPHYETEPPTSGPGAEAPDRQADGAYAEEPETVQYVSSLAHGRIAIQYAPDLPEWIQVQLKGVYDTMYGGALFFPNRKMNYAVAVTAWTNLLGCTGWEGRKTLDAIRDFGKETWGKYGGEPVEKSSLNGPTPGKPEEPNFGAQAR